MTTSIPGIPHSTETVSKHIKHQVRTVGKTYAELGRETGVPAGTLWHIANGGKVPRRWRARLGLMRLFDMPVAELRWAIENRYSV